MRKHLFDIETKTLAYRINVSLLILIAFMIPLKKEWIGLVISLFLISSFFNTDSLQQIILKLKRNRILILFFCITLIGLFYTENIDVGWRNIETKLSLIIFPIAFSISSINYESIKGRVFKSFIEGTLIAIFFGITNVIFHYIETNTLSLFYGKIAYFNHNSYLALYINLTLIILYSNLFSKSVNLNIKPYLSVILIVFFSVIIGLLASKAGIISLLIIHITSISLWALRKKKIMIGFSILLGISLFFTSLYFISTEFKQRIDEFTISINGTNTHNTTTKARISTWESAAKIIKQRPIFGVGTGDVQKELDAEHINNGDLFLYKKHLNAHNQFLQTAIGIGIFGVLSLISIFILPLFKSIKRKDIGLFLFFLILIINLLSESMLEKQEGVVFISYFTVLFSLIHNSKEKNSIIVI